MDRPGWTAGYSKWGPSVTQSRGRAALSSRPTTLYSQPPRTSEEISRDRKRSEVSPPMSEFSSSRLGRTEGSFAAGAWAAREELAALIEAGVPAEELLAEIRSGQEGTHPLKAIPVPELKPDRSRSPVSSKASAGRNMEKRAKSVPRRLSLGGVRLSDSISFSKRARPPSEEPDGQESHGYSPGSPLEEGEVSRESINPGVTPEESKLTFRKKAVKPKEEVPDTPKQKDYRDLRVPIRKDISMGPSIRKC